MLDVNKTTLQAPGSLLKFHGWVTIFVAHFLAKRTLEYHSALLFRASPNDFAKPEIKILAVDSEEYELPSWDKFKRVIRDALTGLEEEVVKQIIDTLESKIIGNDISVPKEVQKGLRTMKQVIKGDTKTITLRMHCEAVFAALLEARGRPTDIDTENVFKTLAEIWKVLGFVSRYNTFHSYFPRTWKAI